MHCDNDKRQSTSETRVRRKTFRERRSNQCWAFNKAIEYNLRAFFMHCENILSKQKEKNEKKANSRNCVSISEKKEKRKPKASSMLPAKSMECFPAKTVCLWWRQLSRRSSSARRVWDREKKKKKNKVGAFRARVNAHVKLAALRLHNSVASKNTTAAPTTRSCRAQLERHSKDNPALDKKAVHVLCL